MANRTPSATTVSASDLQRVAKTRIFFGHQSVGADVLAGVVAVFAAHGVDPPPMAQQRRRVADPAGSITHDLIGQNQEPLTKIEDFAAIMRSGMAQQVDVAMMKLCYVDVRTDTDVAALFAAYRDTLSSLRDDYCEVRFVAVTVPLTTEPSLRTRTKNLVTRGDRFGPAENARREQLNALLRQEYADDLLFDLATAESTAPDGSRTAGVHGEQAYFSLHCEYAADLGHLDVQGSQRVAQAWLSAVARAVDR